MGFEKFVGLEDIPNAKTRGKFVSDEVLTDAVLSELKNRKDPESPAFVFAISMENHFSYEGDKYAEHEIDVEAPALSEDDRLTLKNYVQGVHNADRELGRLVTELEKSGRPTVLAFFGDHMGILGEEYRIYSKTGYLKSSKVNDWTQEEYLSMHTTPYLVWDNFRKRGLPREHGTVRAVNFSEIVFDAAGIVPKDPVFHAASEAKECLGAIPSDAVGTPECASALSNWRKLQYFHLFDSK